MMTLLLLSMPGIEQLQLEDLEFCGILGCPRLQAHHLHQLMQPAWMVLDQLLLSWDM